jgi:serine/threonine protein phosphatase PrpC
MQVVVANVGDSRAVLCRGGRAVDLSGEHRVWGKTPEVQAEIARIESVGGWVDDGRVCGVLAVSRWVR